MKKKSLFPATGGFLHGGDYNPEQWLDRPDILKEDIKMMKKAGINSATLGVFSWSVYEPSEGEYNFGWLTDVMDNLYENGIYTVLATPSGARPAWLDEKYPEAMRVDNYGHRNHHGFRHNHCMSSPVYREKVSNIIHKLVENAGSHPGLVMWHISNEFGGECYCPLCVKRFQDYLADKFDNDISKLNYAWWNTFWSHNYNSFSQIEPPFANGEISSLGLDLEWKRFTTWNMTDYMKSEINILKKLTPAIPVTTNFMQMYGGLDYHVMAKELDVVSWDSYPALHNQWETFTESMESNSFDHAILRSMKKDKPFMLMESAPGLVNWQQYNKVKRPGVHKLFSLQAVACGSDTVQYFQWRKGRGSFEQYHGAVVDHLGTDDTRIFKETEDLGNALKKISKTAGTIIEAKAALLYDWDNRWAIEDIKGLSNETKNYNNICYNVYRQFLRLGIEMDVIASDSGFMDYDIVVAPMLYMLRPGVADEMKAFVEKGGQLLATYLTGYVDINQLCYLGGFPGDGLKDLFGVISEEIDTLYPCDTNNALFKDGSLASIKDYAETLRVSDAEVIASYTDDFYSGTPVVTKKKYGKGCAYYIGARICDEKMSSIFLEMAENAGITRKELPYGVEYHKRTSDGESYEFYLNNSEEVQKVKDVKGINLLNGEQVNGILELGKYETAVIENV
jgi:beta-galactosidase